MGIGVGYRTRRSQSSKEAWEYANKKFGIYMVVAGILSLLIDMGGLIFYGDIPVGDRTCISMLVAVVIISFVIGFIFIEKDLKLKFKD